MKEEIEIFTQEQEVLYSIHAYFKGTQISNRQYKFDGYSYEELVDLKMTNSCRYYKLIQKKVTVKEPIFDNIETDYRVLFDDSLISSKSLYKYIEMLDFKRANKLIIGVQLLRCSNLLTLKTKPLMDKIWKIKALSLGLLKITGRQLALIFTANTQILNCSFHECKLGNTKLTHSNTLNSKIAFLGITHCTSLTSPTPLDLDFFTSLLTFISSTPLCSSLTNILIQDLNPTVSQISTLRDQTSLTHITFRIFANHSFSILKEQKGSKPSKKTSFVPE
ncbi:unnamed protein product [Moneuplotes crassus]|uniref:Uncharacterized protein n=1 Tax=Euplotes crassus TaxID=5936 RepID=A0AAD1XQT8_EUPCR|nr:unnamed protein product [Moneuplotes crassus]